jgi:hypothetical protein
MSGLYSPQVALMATTDVVERFISLGPQRSADPINGLNVCHMDRELESPRNPIRRGGLSASSPRWPALPARYCSPTLHAASVDCKGPVVRSVHIQPAIVATRTGYA